MAGKQQLKTERHEVAMPYLDSITKILGGKEVLTRFLDTYEDRAQGYSAFLIDLLYQDADVPDAARQEALLALGCCLTPPVRKARPGDHSFAVGDVLTFPWRMVCKHTVDGGTNGLLITTPSGAEFTSAGMSVRTKKAEYPRDATSLAAHLSVNRCNSCPFGLACCLNLLRAASKLSTSPANIIYRLMVEASSNQVAVDPKGPLLAAFFVGGAVRFARASPSPTGVIAPTAPAVPSRTGMRAMLLSHRKSESNGLWTVTLPSGGNYVFWVPSETSSEVVCISGPYPTPTAYGWLIPCLFGAAYSTEPLAVTPHVLSELDRLPGIASEACIAQRLTNLKHSSHRVEAPIVHDEDMFSY